MLREPHAASSPAMAFRNSSSVAAIAFKNLLHVAVPYFAAVRESNQLYRIRLCCIERVEIGLYLLDCARHAQSRPNQLRRGIHGVRSRSTGAGTRALGLWDLRCRGWRWLASAPRLHHARETIAMHRQLQSAGVECIQCRVSVVPRVESLVPGIGRLAPFLFGKPIVVARELLLRRQLLEVLQITPDREMAISRPRLSQSSTGRRAPPSPHPRRS